MDAEQPREVAPPTTNTLTVIQIVLAVLAVLLLAGSFLLRRR